MLKKKNFFLFWFWTVKLHTKHMGLIVFYFYKYFKITCLQNVFYISHSYTTVIQGASKIQLKVLHKTRKHKYSNTSLCV